MRNLDEIYSFCRPKPRNELWLKILTWRRLSATLSKPKNRKKGSWEHLSIDELVRLASDEIAELSREVELGCDPMRLSDEAGDVIAYMAMIVEKTENL